MTERFAKEDMELREDVRLKCRNDYGMDLTDAEIDMCILEMERRQVSIFHGHVWPNKRVINRQTNEYRLTWPLTIDGHRAIARRYGLCKMLEPEFQEDVVDGKKVLVSAKVSVWRRRANGTIDGPFTGLVRYDEFVEVFYDKREGRKRPTSQWEKRPYNQLAKCAETQALRKGFAELLDGYEDAPVEDVAEKNYTLTAVEYDAPSSPIAESLKQAAAEEPVDEGQQYETDEKISHEIKDAVENAMVHMTAATEVSDYRSIMVPLLKIYFRELNGGKKLSWSDMYKKTVDGSHEGSLDAGHYKSMVEATVKELQNYDNER